MDLREKLKYYHQGERHKQDHPVDTQITELCKQLNAELVDPDAAPVLRIEQFHPYEQFIPVLDHLPEKYIRIPLLSQNQFPQKIPLEHILLFDLETTGLAGGAGTYPFLIGFACFEPMGLRTVQYFLPDYGREQIAFLAMRTMLQDKKILLSFNGKSYDYPLLRNRFILNRMDNPFLDYAHLDLLHVSRRIWKGALDNFGLESIEREIFRFSRYGDINGWLIPQAYFDFIRSGESNDIIHIINHNALDLMSTARLSLHLHHIENTSASDHEILRLMHLAVRRNQIVLTEEFLTALKGRGIGVPEHIMVDYSLLLKRYRKWEQAVSIWNKLCHSGDHVLFAHLELAKYYEHHCRDFQMAEKHTEQAQQFIQTIRELRDDIYGINDEKDLSSRLERIRNKATKHPSSD